MEQALRLEVRGWVSNLADGRVEVLAIGSDAAIVELAAWLEHGPPAASVTGVESAPEDPATVDVPEGFAGI